MRIPKFRKNGDGRAFAVYPNSNGKREYFGKYGTIETETAYKHWLQRLLNTPVPVRDTRSNLTVIDAGEMYFAHIRSRVSENEYAIIVRFLRFLLKRYGNLTIRSVTPLHISELIDNLTNSTYTIQKTVKRYTRSYINACLSRMKTFFKWSAQNDLIPVELYSKIRLIDRVQRGKAREPAKIRSVPVQQVIAIRDHVSPLIWDMIQTQYLCGMRPGEMCRLRFCEIDTSGPVWLFRPEQHKTQHHGHDLVKAIPLPAQQIIEKYRTDDDREYLFRPILAFSSRGLKIKTKHKHLRQCYDSATYGRAVANGCVRAGVPVFMPNRLRHAIATELRQLVGIEAAQQYLGHSRTDMTEVYVDRDAKRLAEIAGMLTTNPFEKRSDDSADGPQTNRVESVTGCRQ